MAGRRRDGRDPTQHGYPVPVADLIASLPATAYPAPGGEHRGGGRTKRYLTRAFEASVAGDGISFVEVLSMWPTGWFVPTADGPGYLTDIMEEMYGWAS